MRSGFALCGLFIFGVPLAPNRGVSQTLAQSTVSQEVPQTQLYGQQLSHQRVVPLRTILQNPERYANKQVLVTGHIRRVCKKKGCWIELAPSTAQNEQSCRVTFKNYGFFVPKTSAGSKAKLQGTVTINKIEKAAVAHLESDGAHFAHKATDGTAHEVRIVATGIELSPITP